MPKKLSYPARMRVIAAGVSESDRRTPDGSHKSTAAAASLFKPAPLQRTPQTDWLKRLIEIYIYLDKLWTFSEN